MATGSSGTKNDPEQWKLMKNSFERFGGNFSETFF
jgi:hypothetical protein